jgi:hypothetical protein
MKIKSFFNFYFFYEFLAYQVPQARKQKRFIENSKMMKFQPKKGIEKACF